MLNLINQLHKGSLIFNLVLIDLYENKDNCPLAWSAFFQCYLALKNLATDLLDFSFSYLRFWPWKKLHRKEKKATIYETEAENIKFCFVNKKFIGLW